MISLEGQPANRCAGSAAGELADAIPSSAEKTIELANPETLRCGMLYPFDC